MTAYIRGKLLSTVIVLFGVSLLSFMILHLIPGDPVQVMSGQTGASASDMEKLRHQLGLDNPIYVQYVNFITNALQGDLGRSIISRQPVSRMVLDQIVPTIKLTVAGMGLAIVMGVTLGIAAAVRPNSLLDSGIMIVATLGIAIPSFWFALLLIYAFSVHYHWFPAAGGQGLKPLVLPAVTLGISAAAVIARLTRSSMLEVMRQDYIGTARAKGLRERAVVYRHGLKNALIPVVTVVGLQFGALLSGAVIVETVFARQGIGRLAIDAILNKDYPLVQGTVLITATAYVLTNLVIDLLYAMLDPRLRHG
ncbi:MAG TPA: nickel ABC transporter permease [Thermomicrobiales bacterium]|nr:nickel ABC transporter permease [Thermomicrobiales bacterium]